MRVSLREHVARGDILTSEHLRRTSSVAGQPLLVSMRAGTMSMSWTTSNSAIIPLQAARRLQEYGLHCTL